MGWLIAALIVILVLLLAGLGVCFAPFVPYFQQIGNFTLKVVAEF